MTAKAVKKPAIKSEVTEVSITLEFAGDLAETDLGDVRKAFKTAQLLSKRTDDSNKDVFILVYVFDDENVIERIEGEITGKAGDAFRVVAVSYPDIA